MTNEEIINCCSLMSSSRFAAQGACDMKDNQFKEYLDNACEFLENRLFPTVKVQEGEDIDVINRHQLIEEFRKAMTAE